MTSIVGTLDSANRMHLVEAVTSNVSAQSVTEIAKQCFSIRKRLDVERAEWASNVKEMLEILEGEVSKALGKDLLSVVTSPAFVSLVDGVGFSTDVLEFILEMVLARLREDNAAQSYQALVGSLELREVSRCSLSISKQHTDEADLSYNRMEF